MGTEVNLVLAPQLHAVHCSLLLRSRPRSAGHAQAQSGSLRWLLLRLQLIINQEMQPSATADSFTAPTSGATIGRDVGADGGGAAAFAERAGLLFRIAARLKRLADQYRLAVVTVNQVSDVMTGPDGAAIAPVSRRGRA